MTQIKSEKTYMMNNSVTNKSRIKVVWKDRPENYSRAAKNEIQSKMAKKLGVGRNNIVVDYIPVKINKDGKAEIYIPQAENIGDPEYQKNIFKQWYDIEPRKCSFQELMTIDYDIESSIIKEEVKQNRRRWSINWLFLDNFMSFGDKNYLPMSEFSGIISVTSNPQNTGGKTTMTIEALQFLLFGNTNKTDKNEEIFNRYTDKDSVVVRGEISIEGEDEFIIERKLTRSKKKDGTYTVNGKVNYYKIMPNGDEESMNDQDSIRTTKLISETIGSDKDFELVTVANSSTLDSIIKSTPTENSKTFNRFTGLDILETKESLAREKFNALAKTFKSNQYDIHTLNDEIQTMQSQIEVLMSSKSDNEVNLRNETESINKMEEIRDNLMKSLKFIDQEISKSNIESIERNIASITDDGVKLKGEISDIKNKISEISDVFYDEYEEKMVNDEISKLTTDLAVTRANTSALEREIISLQNGEVCQSCKRRLDDVDNSSIIDEKKDLIAKNTGVIANIETKVANLRVKSENFGVLRKKINEKQLLEIDLGRKENKILELRSALTEFKGKKDKYTENLSSITYNRDTQINIDKINTDISVVKFKIKSIDDKLNVIKNELNSLDSKISLNNGLISTIEAEMKKEAIYTTYISMVGRKGVSKIILRSLLPLINMELARITDQTCDFDVEVRITDKNEFKLFYIKDGVEGPLKTSSGFESTVAGLALRTVLGHISTLPRPDFVCFDEVLDKVSKQYLNNMKLIFERISTLYYSKVFVISHEEMVRDWASKNINIVKGADNLSQITLL